MTIIPSDTMADARLPAGAGGLFYGVYPAVVTDIADPDGQGRVRVKLPWTTDGYEAWSRLATLMAGGNRGSWFIPDVEDEVLVCFEAGNPRRPYVIGALWNGIDAPPEEMDGSGENNIKSLRSRSGVHITIDDSSGQESITIETPGGHKVTLDDGGTSVIVEDSGGSSITLDPGGVTVDTPSQVNVNASMVNISAGMVKVDAGMSKFSGVVQADTVISNSVVSASYTPGAGNIW